MNKKIVMLLAALMTLSAGGAVLGGHAKHHKVEKKHMRHEQQGHAAAAGGGYGDRFKSPAWGVESLFYNKKWQMTVAADYSYAADSYGSSGSGSKSNVTRLAFGEQPIRVQDILLASRLLAQGSPAVILVAPVLDLLANANNPLTLIGKSESYGVNLALSRYVFSNNVSVGLDVPVVYKHNRLHIDTDQSTHDLASFYRGPAYVKEILRAKGINEVGGSAAGLGDVSMFISSQINSSKFDKLVAGVRWQMPTGKKQSMSKLWSPDLGNGGFTELSLFGNAAVSYKKCVNPHVSLSAGCSLPAHVDRRVPKKFTVENTGGERLVSQINQELAFGDQINIKAGTADAPKTFSGFDSLIPNFGDTVSRVKITRGAEVKMRLGNIIERFVSSRGFMDVFYDFRAKMKDMVSDLAADQYDVGSVRSHSNQLEHRLGFDYSYQYDSQARLRLGTRYTFAGMNVPKTFDIAGSFNYAF